MKVQLKFKNKVYENYLIDDNGVIYDLNGNIQETYQNQGRPHFKGNSIHSLVIHSFIGYKENMHVHHLNGNKFDNRLENLVYLTPSEHNKLHHIGKAHSLEACIKMSDSRKGKIWVHNGELNKRVYPDQIPEGFVKGRLINRISN